MNEPDLCKLFDAGRSQFARDVTFLLGEARPWPGRSCCTRPGRNSAVPCNALVARATRITKSCVC